MLPGETRRGAVLVDRGRADRQRAAERPDPFAAFLDRTVVAGGRGFENRAGKGDPGRDRKTVPHRLPEPDRLRAENSSVLRLLERDNLLHPNTVTSPALPSTRTLAPSPIRPVASRVPTTPGMPYSRATIAERDKRPPLSVTTAPSKGRGMLNASVCDSLT